jgi:hypothetical protein
VSLEPDDREALDKIRRVRHRYERSTEPMAEPLAVAVIRELGGDWEARGHEVAMGYLERVLGLAPDVVSWVVNRPMSVGVAKEAMDRMLDAAADRAESVLLSPEDRELLSVALRGLRPAWLSKDRIERRRGLLEALERSAP